MVTGQSANQPAKVSWAFKMVSQFGSLGYTIMGKTADLTKQKESLPSIEYIYSKLTYFPEGQQFTKNIFYYWSYEVF